MEREEPVAKLFMQRVSAANISNYFNSSTTSWVLLTGNQSTILLLIDVVFSRSFIWGTVPTESNIDSFRLSTEKMSAVELNPRPVRVSPLIKFGRWSMLLTGIVYGIVHQSRLTKKEAAIREVEDKKKAIRDKKLAEERRIASAAELANLEAMLK